MGDPDTISTSYPVADVQWLAYSATAGIRVAHSNNQRLRVDTPVRGHFKAGESNCLERPAVKTCKGLQVCHPGTAQRKVRVLKQQKSLLFVSPQAPGLASNPSAARSAEALALFSNHYNVTLACPATDRAEMEALADSLGLDGLICAPIDTDSSRAGRDTVASHLNRVLAPGEDTAFSSSLKALVDERARDFDILVLDHFYAFFYRPRSFAGPIIYHAHAAHFADMDTAGLGADLGRDVLAGMRKRELDACSTVDHVFAAPDDALRLADAGVPFGKLACSLVGHRHRARRKEQVDFNRTKPQLLYVGYLGDADNVRSLLWFIKQVLPQLRETLPDLPLHLVGRDPDLRLLTLAMADPHIHFHESLEDAETAGESFRVSIDPLLYEQVVDTKLINDMARGTPTVTTVAALARLRGPAPGNIAAAQSSGDMAAQIRQLLTDKSAWRKLASGNSAFARQHLPAHDLMFRLRQQLGDHSAVA